jgi:hypothetical protein
VETKGINDAIHWKTVVSTVLFQYFQFFTQDEVKVKDEDESEKLEAVIIV